MTSTLISYGTILLGYANIPYDILALTILILSDMHSFVAWVPWRETSGTL